MHTWCDLSSDRFISSSSSSYNSLTTIHTTLPYKHHYTRLCEPPMAVGSRGGARTMEIVERVTPAGSTRAFRKFYLLLEI